MTFSPYRFYNCSGKEWEVVEVQGSSSPQSAYDANDVRLGSVMFVDWPQVGMRLSDGALGVFNLNTGKFAAALCNHGLCHARFVANSKLMETPYCHFDSPSCSGTCYVFGQPLKHTIILSTNGTWVQASGVETPQSVAIASYWRHDFSDCVATGGTASVYPIDGQYSLPSDMAYPFSGPLSVK